MDMKTAEEVVLALGDPTSPYNTQSMRQQAFAWAERKRHDRRVAPEFRRRASVVARVVFAAAGKKP